MPLGMRFRVLLAEGADADPEFVAARDRALAPLITLVARAVGEEVVDPDVSPSWTGLVLTSLLVAAARAAAAGTIDTDEAAELVSRTLFEGLGAARAT